MNVVNKLYAYGGAVAIGTSQLLLAGKAYAIDAVQPIDTRITSFDLLSSADDAPTTFRKIATAAINIVLLIAGVLAVLFLLWSGLKYITSAGDPEKAKGARAGIINAVIGIVVIFTAYFIIITCAICFLRCTSCNCY